MGVIYGPNDRLGRNALFAELKNIVVAINKPILLLGSFNVVLHSWERIETFRGNLSMREFCGMDSRFGFDRYSST